MREADVIGVSLAKEGRRASDNAGLPARDEPAAAMRCSVE